MPQSHPPTDPLPPPPRPIEILARGVWVEHGQVLLCRNISGGYFYLPGGHVEFGEPAGEALQRELMEEAGVTVIVGDCLLVGEASFEQGGRTRHEINLVFHVEHASTRSGATPTPVRSIEPHIGFEWVAIAGLKDVDVRPRWLADWLMAQRGSQRGTGAAWVSVMSVD